MKDINIIISGQVGTGKSTICQLISETLAEHNFTNVEICGEEENSQRFKETFEDRLKNINKEDISINLCTVQTKRDKYKQGDRHQCLICKGEGVVEYTQGIPNS